ncbi:Pyruvate decarboxylase 3 [Sarracenia purpurea var. burkii]
MAKSRRERHEQKKGEGGPLWRRRAKPTWEELETAVRKVESDGDGYVSFCELTGLSAKSIDSDEVSKNLKWACSRSSPTKCRDGYRDRLILEKRNRMYKMVLPLELSDLEAGEEEAFHILLRA